MCCRALAGCRGRAAGVEEVLLLLLRFLRGYRALHLVKAHEDPEVQHVTCSNGHSCRPDDASVPRILLLTATGRLPVSAASPFGIRIEVA